MVIVIEFGNEVVESPEFNRKYLKLSSLISSDSESESLLKLESPLMDGPGESEGSSSLSSDSSSASGYSIFLFSGWEINYF